MYFVQVYHAYPQNWAEFVKNAAVESADVQKRCVALKVATRDKKELTESPQDVALGNEIKILREFANLENEEYRRHLVKLYYEGHLLSLSEGQITPNRNKAYAMELGEIALSNYLYKNAGKLTNDEIKVVAKDIALAILDLHRGKE
jgi:hypothetical protein